MHQYRTHNCNELNKNNTGETVKLSGWVNRVRDHGGLLFLDLRDNYGLTQCVIDNSHSLFATVDNLSNETVITIVGKVLTRSDETINNNLPTGEIEVQIQEIEVQSVAQTLPFPVNQDTGYPEDMRLKYRFLDLRMEQMHKNILLRSNVIASLRNRMIEQGFTEFQTPILTASSPEGARDFLVPSRLHPGKFYALPQAPQQFKQLLMVSGFDKYFQIAPCFRDEDARADRSPGEFYQLDFEMSFTTQEDVFAVLEPVLHGVFQEFGNGKKVTQYPFPRIAYKDAMLKYGSDKPDLRNPIVISDVSDAFAGSDFKIFAGLIEKGCVVRAIPAPNSADKARSFFDKLNNWARSIGQAGLGYIQFKDGQGVGPIAKNLSDDRIAQIKDMAGVSDGDSVFFACGVENEVATFAGQARAKIAQELDLIKNDEFNFCWIVDFPMFEYNEEEKKVDFSHNPFSMPQGGMEALLDKDPLDILAYQYDIVCNGFELSSGAIRNHLPEIMYKAFEIAGYSQDFVDEKFAGMINAFKYGAPPHGGSAPGIDRIVMLLADEPNIRQITAFPLNQNAQDLMMQAPNNVSDKSLEDVHIRVKMPTKVEV
ncbi:MAG: aspartate--tRNA ligase [Alphaproteobacteria bacterium]|nr:aspartate--tRNA ligase [Alphaproteobacteria bacterium]